MPFRFFQRVRIAPGLTLNLSKGGVSVSAGPRGAKFTAGTSGARGTVGLPGSGLFYTVSDPLGKAAAATGARASNTRGASVPASRKPSLSFLKRLVASPQEKAFVDGLAALSEGNSEQALQAMETALASDPALADAAWLAGLYRLQQEDYEAAARHFMQAHRNAGRLGQGFDKYQLVPRVMLPITPEVNVRLPANAQGALLGLVEALQLQGKGLEALPYLESLLKLDAQDPVALASFAEIVLDGQDPQRWQQVVEWTAGVENETVIHTAVLFYRGQALVKLGMDHAAEGVFTTALRRTKDRSETLLRDIRYQRALVYERTGKKAQARRELERLYAEDPGFEDVAQRLGVQS